MTATVSLLTVWRFLVSAWSGIGPLVGVLIGAWLTRSWQRMQWVLESKKAEYRELISTLTASYRCIYRNLPVVDAITAMSSEQDREIGEAWDAGLRVIEDRIFIDKEVRAENIRERWEKIAGLNLRLLPIHWNDLHDVLVKMAHRGLGIKK